MRTIIGVGTAMLLVAMLGGAAAFAASDTAQVNASFSIPSWISLSVSSGQNVSFADITGPGTYDGSNETQLRVLSTTSWDLTHEILWAESTLPAGANQDVLNNSLVRSLSASSGTWGPLTVTVDYSLTLGEDDMAQLPQGDYSLVIQYTATTK